MRRIVKLKGIQSRVVMSKGLQRDGCYRFLLSIMKKVTELDSSGGCTILCTCYKQLNYLKTSKSEFYGV